MERKKGNKKTKLENFDLHGKILELYLQHTDYVGFMLHCSKAVFQSVSSN